MYESRRVTVIDVLAIVSLVLVTMGASLAYVGEYTVAAPLFVTTAMVTTYAMIHIALRL